MKLRHWLTVVAGGLCAAVVIAGADEFTDFRIPDNTSRLWNVSASALARGSSVNFDVRESKLNSSNADLLTALTWITDSDPLRRTVGIGGSVGVDRDQRRDAYSSDDLRADRNSRMVDESWSASIDETRYPWSVPIGAEWQLSGSGRYQQSWEKTASEDLTPGMSGSSLESEEFWFYTTSARVRVVVGVGRVRNATGVQEARVIERRLRNSGVLSRSLSPVAREKLARLMYTRDDLNFVADRPAGYLWSAVAAILEEDGALGEQARDPGAWSHAFDRYVGPAFYERDLVPRPTMVRNTGFFVGPYFSGDYFDELHRDDFVVDQSSTVDTVSTSNSTSISRHGESRTSATTGGLRAEWHRPLGLSWQADASADYLFPLKHADQFVLQSLGQLSYLAADRWSGSVTVAYGQSHYWETHDWGFGVGESFIFYMEDHLALTVSASHSQDHFLSAYHRENSVRIGLTYRLAGSFAAPGLLTPALGRGGPLQ